MKSITIRIPDDLWKALYEAKAAGKIKSISQAALDGMGKILSESK